MRALKAKTVFIGLAAVLAAHGSPVSAARLLITYSGAMTSGIDSTGFFGVRGADLSGSKFIANYVFDTGTSAPVYVGPHSREVDCYAPQGCAAHPISSFIEISGSKHSFDGNYEGRASKADGLGGRDSMLYETYDLGLPGNRGFLAESSVETVNNIFNTTEFDERVNYNLKQGDSGSFYVSYEDRQASTNLLQGFGTVDNVSVSAFSSPSPPPKPLTLICNGSAVCDQTTFDSSKPTVVITHGWRPDDDPAAWVGEMASAISAATSKLVGANVIQAYWEDAKTDDLKFAKAHTSLVGQLLANALSDLGSLEGGVQFIGHSLGTHVNAYAAKSLTDTGITVDQVTILDRPFGKSPSENAQFLSNDTEFFRTELPKDKVIFVDNYYGGLFSAGASFDAPVVAKNVQYDGANHGGVHDRYEATIGLGGSCGPDGGFSCSIAIANQFRAPSERWDPGISANPMRDVGPATDFSDSSWSGLNCDVTSGHSATCREGSPAYLWNGAFSFDQAAQFLSFDIDWIAIGDGDWATLDFGDDLLYAFTGTAAKAGVIRSSGLISVQNYAGKSGALTFALNDVGARNAAFSISNLRVLGNTASVPEPNVWIMFILGFGVVGLMLRFEKSGHRVSVVGLKEGAQ